MFVSVASAIHGIGKRVDGADANVFAIRGERGGIGAESEERIPGIKQRMPIAEIALDPVH